VCCFNAELLCCQVEPARPSLGRLYDFFNRIELDITQEVQSSTLHNVALEARVEGISLRLSKLTTVSNRDEKHLTVCLDVENSLRKNRELDKIVAADIKKTMRRLEEDGSEELVQLLVDQTKQRRYHLDEIKRQEARESVTVAYSVTTTGESVLLPMGVSLRPDFLPFPVCWAPAHQPGCGTQHGQGMQSHALQTPRRSGRSGLGTMPLQLVCFLQNLHRRRGRYTQKYGRGLVRGFVGRIWCLQVWHM
jgi:hypothetical protein